MMQIVGCEPKTAAQSCLQGALCRSPASAAGSRPWKGFAKGRCVISGCFVTTLATGIRAMTESQYVVWLTWPPVGSMIVRDRSQCVEEVA